MAILRATFFFECNNYGWSETWHNMAANVDACRTAAEALMPKRTALLGAETFLTYIRVSDDLVKRDALLVQIPTANGRGTTASPSAHPDLSLVTRCQASDPTVRKTAFLRGWPDSLEVNGGQLNFASSPGVAQAFANFALELIQGGWAIRYKDPLVTQLSISNITQDLTNGRTTITTALPHGFVPNDAIVITGVRGANAVNGYWSVFSQPSLTTFVILPRVVLGAWTGGGLVSKSLYKLAPITFAISRYVGERKSGRPFGQPRGRRRVIRR